MYTLTIVDMQEHWLKVKESEEIPLDKKNIVEKVIGLIRKAKEDKAGIVVLEYNERDWQGCKKTLQEIRDELKDADHIVKLKNDCGGGSFVIKGCEEKKFSLSDIRLCGVNYDQCVYETAKELKSYNLQKVSVIRGACNYTDRTNWADEYYQKHKVELV